MQAPPRPLQTLIVHCCYRLLHATLNSCTRTLHCNVYQAACGNHRLFVLAVVDGELKPASEKRLKGEAAIELLRGGTRNVQLLGGRAGPKLTGSKSLAGLRSDDISRLLNQHN